MWLVGEFFCEAGRGAPRRRRTPEASAGGRARRVARSGRAERPPEAENLDFGLDFGGLVIVEGIDDLEVVVMKIGVEVMDFEDTC